MKEFDELTKEAAIHCRESAEKNLQKDKHRARLWLTAHIADCNKWQDFESVRYALSAYARQVRGNTFRKVRSQLRRYYESEGHASMAGKVALVDNPVPVESRPKPKPRYKGCAREQWGIVHADRKRVGDWAGMLALVIARLCGLRPAELLSASVGDEDGVCIIRLIGAKLIADERGIPVRELVITDAGSAELLKQAIPKFQTMVRDEADLKRLQNRLSAAVRRLFPDHAVRPSLYKMRHQFASDLKAEGIDSAEIAALMGHRDQDSQIDYGRSRNGDRRSSVRATDRTVAQVNSKPMRQPPGRRFERRL